MDRTSLGDTKLSKEEISRAKKEEREEGQGHARLQPPIFEDMRMQTRAAS
jgi:hypothetical protein